MGVGECITCVIVTLIISITILLIFVSKSENNKEIRDLTEENDRLRLELDKARKGKIKREYKKVKEVK